MNGLIPGVDYIPPIMLAPAGTRTIFNMAAAPLGWVQDTTAGFSDCALRINTTSNAGTIAGTTGWSGWNFGGTVNSASITLSLSQIPSHTHTVNDSGHVASASTGGNMAGVPFAGNSVNSGGSQTYIGPTTTTTNTANVSVGTTGSGSAFQIGLSPPQIKFNDYLVAVKS